MLRLALFTTYNFFCEKTTPGIYHKAKQIQFALVLSSIKITFVISCKRRIRSGREISKHFLLHLELLWRYCCSLFTRLIARSDGSLLPVFSCYMGYFFKKVVKKIRYPDGGFLVTLLGLFDDRCSFQCGRAGFWLKYVQSRPIKVRDFHQNESWQI